MSKCNVLLASFASNVAIIVRDLMFGHFALSAPQRQAPAVYDVDGRAYCGCGAANCIEMEGTAPWQQPGTAAWNKSSFKNSWSPAARASLFGFA